MSISTSSGLRRLQEGVISAVQVSSSSNCQNSAEMVDFYGPFLLHGTSLTRLYSFLVSGTLFSTVDKCSWWSSQHLLKWPWCHLQRNLHRNNGGCGFSKCGHFVTARIRISPLIHHFCHLHCSFSWCEIKKCARAVFKCHLLASPQLA